MNRGIEEQFVESYIVKNRQERMLFELRGKRREDAVWRFCHRSDEMLIESRIKACGPKIEQVLRQRIAQSRAEKCYVISLFEGLDGKEFGREEVLDLILGRGMPSIAVFDDFAIIETEQVQGPAVKYLLEK